MLLLLTEGSFFRSKASIFLAFFSLKKAASACALPLDEGSEDEDLLTMGLLVI